MTFKNTGYGLAAAAVMMTGCLSDLPSVGPNYVAPAADVPMARLPDAGAPTSNLTATCEYTPAAGSADSRVALCADTATHWWTRFNDPVLVDLVEGAVSNNVNYRIAQTRLEQANWELLGSYAAFLPKFSVDGSAVRSETHRNNRAGALRHKQADNFSAGFNGTWELDIFGGSRRATQAALATAEAAGWTVADAWLALTTEIGRQYINLRTIQARIAVARTNLVLQSETYDILKSRLDSGIGDELAVNQCAYIVEQTRARIPTLLSQEEAYKNALAILAGTMPGALHDRLKPLAVERDWLLAPQKVAELPINMLRSRPDIRAAERSLAAQVARVGVAQALWFPKLYLNGSLGMESTSFSKFLQPGSFYASIGPSVTWPIFQGGNIHAQVKVAEARVEEARLTYTLALQNAYADVRNAYAAYTQEYHRYQALKAGVKAANDAVTISQDLYTNGLKDFNNVLDAQRSRLTLTEEMVVSRGQISLDLIDLYRALGGGLASAE
jgi:NodT family efflux transporter outer membrane factor (OMF) lipoprotein